MVFSDDAVRLAGRLAASLTSDQRVVLFTGTTTGQGGSSVATEVAFAFALLTHEPVILVDAYVDAPRLHDRFGVALAPGFTDVLAGQADVGKAVTSVGEGVSLLPLGGSTADSVGLFGSEEASALLRRFREQYRLVVVDAPPLLQSAPTSVLASRADGVVAVVAEGLSHRGDVVELKRVLDGLKVALVGAVLTIGETEAGRSR
ncbi:MAG TPA: cellulose synthase operon protein YhjQ/BcsQ [Vicinamibacterales bacterium]